MEKKLILRGLLAGAVGGLLAFVFARIFAEPLIQSAIDYETARDTAQNALSKSLGLPVGMDGPDIFSRTIQADVGLGVALILFGAAMGALFAVVYTFCLGRVGNLRPRSLALLVAGGGFLGMYGVPFLKYPANPPSIGHPDTIKDRGNLYLVMVLASILFLVLAVVLGQWLRPRFGTWNATLLAGLSFAVAIGIVMLLLPQVGHLSYNTANYGVHDTETPLPLKAPDGQIVFPGFDADLLYSFRLYSVVAQLILWGMIGLVFAPLADRLLTAGPPTTSPRSGQTSRSPEPAPR
jgi:hypothetical protein